VAYAAIQCLRVRALKNDGGKVKPGDLNPSDQSAVGNQQWWLFLKRFGSAFSEQLIQFLFTLGLLESGVKPEHPAEAEDHETGRPEETLDPQGCAATIHLIRPP
jgi:hypothetical protein